MVPLPSTSGWSGGAMFLGKVQVPIALAVGAGGGCLDIFSLLYLFFSLSPRGWSGGAMVLG